MICMIPDNIPHTVIKSGRLHSVRYVPLVHDLEAPGAFLAFSQVHRDLRPPHINTAPICPSAVCLHELNRHVDVGERDVLLLICITHDVSSDRCGFDYLQLGLHLLKLFLLPRHRAH